MKTRKLGNITPYRQSGWGAWDSPAPTATGRPRRTASAPFIALTAEEYVALNAELARITIHGTRDNRDIAKLGTVPENTGR